MLHITYNMVVIKPIVTLEFRGTRLVIGVCFNPS